MGRPITCEWLKSVELFPLDVGRSSPLVASLQRSIDLCIQPFQQDGTRSHQQCRATKEERSVGSGQNVEEGVRVASNIRIMTT